MRRADNISEIPTPGATPGPAAASGEAPRVWRGSPDPAAGAGAASGRPARPGSPGALGEDEMDWRPSPPSGATPPADYLSPPRQRRPDAAQRGRAFRALPPELQTSCSEAAKIFQGASESQRFIIACGLAAATEPGGQEELAQLAHRVLGDAANGLQLSDSIARLARLSLEGRMLFGELVKNNPVVFGRELPYAMFETLCAVLEKLSAGALVALSRLETPKLELPKSVDYLAREKGKTVYDLIENRIELFKKIVKIDAALGSEELLLRFLDQLKAEQQPPSGSRQYDSFLDVIEIGALAAPAGVRRVVDVITRAGVPRAHWDAILLLTELFTSKQACDLYQLSPSRFGDAYAVTILRDNMRLHRVKVAPDYDIAPAAQAGGEDVQAMAAWLAIPAEDIPRLRPALEAFRARGGRLQATLLVEHIAGHPIEERLNRLQRIREVLPHASWQGLEALLALDAERFATLTSRLPDLVALTHVGDPFANLLTSDQHPVAIAAMDEAAYRRALGLTRRQLANCSEAPSVQQALGMLESWGKTAGRNPSEEEVRLIDRLGTSVIGLWMQAPAQHGLRLLTLAAELHESHPNMPSKILLEACLAGFVAGAAVGPSEDPVIV